MKRLICILAVLLLATTAFSQTQQGYVKTRGRMVDGKHVPGEGLKGAIVSVNGSTPVLVNAEDGAFSFPVTGKWFRVDSVRKRGYELVDPDFCYKHYDYSSRPIDILMEVPGQQMEDYMEDFERINVSQQAMIAGLRAEVKRLKSQNKINEEEYRRRLTEIADMQSESQKLVSEMAERYSKMDFDRLDEFNRQVSWLILNGELIKADSLIRSRGSMEERSAELDRIRKANEEEERELAQRQEDLESSKRLESKKLEGFAEDCYSLGEICFLKHNYDSAAYWLELRASKDTTNIEWQLNVATFVLSYSGQYEKAITYYFLALRQALFQFGEQNNWTAIIYINLGMVCYEQGNYDKALEYYRKALSIQKSVYGETQSIVATIYNNIGMVYTSLANYNKALDCFRKALAIQKDIFEESHPDLATSYNNIGSVLVRQGDYDDAFECFIKALNCLKDVFGEEYSGVAKIYDNIGGLFVRQGLYGKSLEYFEKALAIRKAELDENHTDMATSYNNIGAVCHDLGDNIKALENFNKALNILKNVFGENHPKVYITCYNIGMVYETQGDLDKGLEYYENALSIQQALLGGNHPDVISLFQKINNLAYMNSLKNNTITLFCEDHCFTATVVDDTPAWQQGMVGEYVLLEFGDWNQDATTFLLDKRDELRGKPKDLLVMKDGVISEHHFEDFVGVKFGVKYVGKEEKQRINKAYENWKKQNRK